jgi:hypothetical protein
LLVLVPEPERFQKGLLKEVIRVGGIVRHSEGKVIQQLGLGESLALKGAMFFRFLHGTHRDSWSGAKEDSARREHVKVQHRTTTFKRHVPDARNRPHEEGFAANHVPCAQANGWFPSRRRFAPK